MNAASSTSPSAPSLGRNLLLIVLVSVFILGFLNWQRWLSHDRALLRAEKTTLNLARALARHGQDNIDKADLALSGPVVLLEQAGADGFLASNMALLFRSRLQELPILQNLVWLDEFGQRRVAARTAPGQSPDNSDRGYFIWHRDHADKRAHIGKPQRSRCLPRRTITASACARPQPTA